MQAFEVIYRPLMQASDRATLVEAEPMDDRAGGFRIRLAPGRRAAEFRGHGATAADAIRTVVSSFGRVKLVAEEGASPWSDCAHEPNPEQLAEAVRDGIDYAERLAPGDLFEGTLKAAFMSGYEGLAAHLFAAAAGHRLTRYHRLDVEATDEPGRVRIKSLERRAN